MIKFGLANIYLKILNPTYSAGLQFLKHQAESWRTSNLRKSLLIFLASFAW